jgi:MraZ protein
MFLGEYQHLVDQKGRVILPAKFRDELADGLVVTKGMEKCLFVYTPAEWARLEEGAKELPTTKKTSREFTRLFFSQASKAAPDKQGRVLLPQNLRDYANLKKDVTVIGAGERIEIWDKAAWAAYSAETEESFSDIAEQLEGFGF